MKQFIPVAEWGNYYAWPTVAGLKQIYLLRNENGYEKAFAKAGPYHNSRVLVDPEEFWKVAQSFEKISA